MSLVPSSSTLLHVSGRDALAVLHRIATQKLDDLAAGQARMTCFCDFRGRLLHRACVAVDRDGAVWLLRDDAPGVTLASFLDHHVFREDVRIENRSADRSLTLRFDPGAPRDAPIRLEDRTVAWSGSDSSGWAVPAEAGVSYVVGAADRVTPHDELARVQAGWPRHGHEIAEAFTPFEVGRAHEVHLDKGCFTGQEALMRLITYRSVRRRLVRVRGTGPTPAVPADVVHDEAKLGRLTSVVSEGSGWIGLAVVQHGAIGSSGSTVEGAAIDVAEPLPATRPLGLPG